MESGGRAIVKLRRALHRPDAHALSLGGLGEVGIRVLPGLGMGIGFDIVEVLFMLAEGMGIGFVVKGAGEGLVLKTEGILGIEVEGDGVAIEDSGDCCRGEVENVGGMESLEGDIDNG